NQVTRRIPSKQGGWGNSAVLLWPSEVRTGGEFSRRGSGQRMGLIGGELDVTGQGLPVEFDHLARRLGTIKGWRDTALHLMEISAFQLECIRGQGVGQLDLVANRKGFEGSKLATG